MEKLIIPGLTAAATLIANILYFKYQTKKIEYNKIKTEYLTKLLFPLYVALKEDERLFEWDQKNGDPYENESDKPERLSRLIKIIEENLYLADHDLHIACENFMTWAILADKEERFQRIHSSTEKLEEDRHFEDFSRLVIEKYNQVRKELKIIN